MAQVEAAAPDGGVEPPRPEVVREQLARIQASADFDVPDRVHKFLRYVVEETLAGRADRIKAYSIALEVFGRDPSFDAQADPVVRIEAGRMRRALERYYLTAGRSDPLLITIPKGGYVPHFEERGSNEEPSMQIEVIAPAATAWWQRLQRWRPHGAMLLAGLIVAAPLIWLYLEPDDATRNRQSNLLQPDIPRLLIEPFEDLTGTEDSAIVTRGLTEEVIGQIAKFKDLQVVEGRPASVKAVAQTDPERSARYVLLGSVRMADDTLRLTARLRRVDEESVLWAQNYDEDLKVQGILAVQANLAREVATALAQPYGVIFEADSPRVTQTPPDNWEAYTCTLAYYTYRQDLSPETYALVRGCLERTVTQFPTYATAWALLSIAYFDGFRFQYDPASESSLLDQAMAAARRAVDLDPENVRGQQALMMAHYLNGEISAALEVGKRALDLNPNDIELRGEYGVRLALSGKWTEGGDIILAALQRSAARQSYYEIVLALGAYMLRDNETAAMWIRKADLQPNPLFHFIAAAIFGHSGAMDEAARERKWILENAKPLLDNIHKEVAMRIARPEDRAYIIEGFTLAGLPIPAPPVEYKYLGQN